MIEKTRTHDIDYIERHPHIKPIDLRVLLLDVYPYLRETSVPDVLTNIIYSTAYLGVNYQKDRLLAFDHHDHHPEAKGIIRGSWLKRRGLGEPPGYDHIHRFFSKKKIKASAKDKFTKTVVKKLSDPPNEIDIRIAEIDIDNVRKALSQSGFKEINLKGKINRFVGENGCRVNVEMHQYKDGYKQCLIHFFQGKKRLLVVDLGELADRYKEDLRLSIFGSGFEIAAIAEFLTTVDGRVTVLWDEKKLDQYHNEYKGKRIDFNEAYWRRFGDLLREIGGKIFWPNTSKEKPYDIRAIIEQLKSAGLSRTYPSFNIESDIKSHGLCPPDQSDKRALEHKGSVLMSDLLLYATYDPFLFLVLAYESKLVDRIPLGAMLNEQIVMDTINEMARKLGFDESYQICSYNDLLLPNSPLPYFSQRYKEKVLMTKEKDLIQTGGLRILKAFNTQIQTVNPELVLPETLDYFVSLLNPLNMPWFQRDFRKKVIVPGPADEVDFYN